MILYELNDNKITRPKLFYIEPFKLGVQERNIVHFNYPIPVWMMVTDNDIPDKNRIRRDKNFALISPLLSDPDFLFLYALNERSPLLRNYAKDNNASYSTIKKLLSNCWKYGRGKQSLTPAYARSGGNGVKKTVKSVSVGRKKKGRALIDGRAETYIMRERDSASIKKNPEKTLPQTEGQKPS